MGSPYIRRVGSQAEIDSLLNQNSVVVVGFHAAWSAPCRGIAPFYSRLAATHRTLTFVKVEIDADNIRSIGHKARLTALPTFIVVKNEEEVDCIRGADREGLEAMIIKYAPEAEPTARGAGSDIIAAGDESLLEFLDMPKVNCLNEAHDHPLKAIVETRTRNTTEAYLESDADEQLLITLPFTQEVKVRSVVLYTKEPKLGPKKIKIDINKFGLGFEDVENAVEPAVIQVLEVPEEPLKEGKPIFLRFVRLQRVKSLHIFVESNHGNEDVTRIDAIDAYGPGCGEPVSTTQITGLRDFLGTHQRGVELLALFQDEGGDQNISNAAALLREAALLCPANHDQRAALVGNLALALLSQYQYQGDYPDLSEAITLYHELLDLHPPGHSNRASFLGNISIALLARYQRNGGLSDLEDVIEKLREALGLCPVGHPDRAWALDNLFVTLLTRYERTGSLSDLEEAIEMGREALNLRLVRNADRASSLNRLSAALLNLYNDRGSLLDLEEAIEQQREALDLYPPSHPDRTGSLTNIANALIARYKREGNLSDFEEAIEKQREALNLCPPSHPDRATYLNNFSNGLLTQYERGGSLPDLEEAIEMQRQTLNLRPPGHPDRVLSLNNLFSALLTRYERKGSQLDLEEVIKTQQEVTDLHPPGHPDRASSFNVLSNAYLAHYEREGSRSDLEKAIQGQRDALDLCPSGHPSRALYLNNFSNTLLARYGREGNLPDLEEAIEKQRDALNLRPIGHPARDLYLDNLSNAFLSHYKHQGGRSYYLEEAIEKQREALNLRPSGHPNRTSSLNRLSSTLLIRYRKKGSLSDMDEAIEQQREALDLYLPGHPDRAASLTNLSNALVTRYDREANLSDLEEAIKKQREALNLYPSGHPDRALFLSNLSNSLRIRYEREGSRAELEEAIGQQREALDLRPPGHPERHSSLNSLSVTLMARYERGEGLADLKEAIEKQREALSLRPSDHPDRASSLVNLSNALRTLYEEESGLATLEEVIAKQREALDLLPTGHPSRSASLVSLSRAYLLTINKRDNGSTMRDQEAMINEALTMLREAVNHPNSPPFHRLIAALQWIDASSSLDSESALDAYSAALDQLDIVLATSNTLANKHARLSSDELVRCQRLGVEAASCAVRQGDMILAVEFLERGRNLLFAQIGRYRVELEELQQVNAELAKRFSDLSGLLDTSVVSSQPTLEGRTTFEDQAGRYRRVASDWDQTVKDIRDVPGFENFLKPPRYKALQAAAAEGPVVVVIPDDGQSHALIISQGRDTPHYVALPQANTDELVTLCNDFIRAVHSDDSSAADKHMATVLRKLWGEVVRPIADALENDLLCPLHSRIWWCPSSVLSFLPLHAAGRYSTNAEPSQNFPSRYVSSYTPTLRALSRARSAHSVSKEASMLIVAQPDTAGQQPLPCTLPEAMVVKVLAEVKMEMKTTSLSRTEGTHAAVLDNMVNHSWIHLICHGSQDPLNPFDSCLHLYDELLSLRDIMQRGLPDAEFAFLAACHTATGDIKLLDEGLHLAAGLQFAGFKSVVGTIREVADIDGPVIAGAFYMALRREQPEEEGVDCRKAAQALSKAVKYLRDNGIPISRWVRYVHIGI